MNCLIHNKNWCKEKIPVLLRKGNDLFITELDGIILEA